MPAHAPLSTAIFETAAPCTHLALQVYAYQYHHNTVYREFADRLGRSPDRVTDPHEIPYLPIELFKSHRILTGDAAMPAPLTFRSSGTTGQRRSTHEVLEPGLYKDSYMRTFEQFYGSPSRYRILALLPGYLERSDSSLVYMVNGLMQVAEHPESGFYLDDLYALRAILQKPSPRRTLLIGVSHALLDLAEIGPLPLQHTAVMETGGMKGRRRELTRHELHAQLKSAFGVAHIHSEYGMTELLSQAYATRDGLFRPPAWMEVRIRESNDPLSYVKDGRTGAINVMDLANLHSCAFIATSDLGRRHADGSFEVLGRMDYSDTRGCNLMVSDL